MSFSQQQLKQPQQPQQPQQTEYSYESSSSSSLTKGLNLPIIPSPLHNTESVVHPTTTNNKMSRNSNDLFFNRHSEDVVTYSPLKNRQAPPPPPPPKMPMQQHRISSSSGSGGALDDDDSLVFKMSELSEFDENEPSGVHNSSFYYGSNRNDYLQKLKMATALNDDDDDDTHSKMRRAVSTGGTPNSTINAAALFDVSTKHSDSSSKSDPVGLSNNKFKTIQQDQGTKITRRLFYGES
jgi:hypothetical protein